MGSHERLLPFLLWIAFIIACFAQLSSGIVFLFSVFQNPLKATYNYTQSEAAMLASLSNVGVGVAFIPGIVFDKFGPTVTSVVGLLLSTGGYLLIWSTAQSITFYRDKSWLLGIYFFIGGNGSTFTYMASMNTTILNFSEKFRGTVCGVMNCCFSAGPAILIYVYYELFVHGSKDVDSNHDYPGFMLTNAVIFGVVNFVCIIFLRIYKKDNCNEEITPTASNVTELRSSWFSKKKGGYQFENTDTLNSADVASFSEGNDKKGQLDAVKHNSSSEDGRKVIAEKQNVAFSSELELDNRSHNTSAVERKPPPEKYRKPSIMDTFKDVNFHIFAWMFGISSAVGTVTMNNVTTTTKSMAQSSYDTYVVLIIPIAGVAVSILSGILSDYLKSKFPRTYFLVLYNVLFIIAGILNTAWAYQLVIFMISTGLCGIAMGIIWSITPTYLSELYHTDNFGRNWGIFLILSAILVFVLQQIFAALYDSKITTGADIVCYGFECIQSGYAVLLSSSIIGLILNIALMFNLARKNK